MYKCGDFWTECKHNDHRNDDSGYHDLYMLRSAARSDNAVKRKHSVDQHDLGNGFAERQILGVSFNGIGIFAFQFVNTSAFLPAYGP